VPADQITGVPNAKIPGVPSAKSQEPRAQRQAPGAKSQKPSAKSQEPSAKSPEPRVNNARFYTFYTSEVTSILYNEKHPRSPEFYIMQNKKTNCAPKRTRLSLVPKGNHRSVL
jgi:hypothetical protein